MPNQTPTQPPENHDLPVREVEIVGHVVRDFLSTRRPHPDLEFDDLVQECLLHWWSQRSRHSQERGASLTTFLRRVVKAKLIDIERGIRAQKRGGGRVAQSLGKSLMPDDPDASTLGDTIRDSTDVESEAMLQITLRKALARLTPRQRRLTSGLSAGTSMSELSKALGVPRPTLYDEMKRIQQVFCDEGLAPYLENPSDT